MSQSTRRHFLQFAGATLGTIALASIEDLSQAASLLSQPSGRKYALLIGIDEYTDLSSLKGCNTDVDLQRELLLHRYGFQREDILELRDAKATYENIINGFQSHLIKQARPGDLIVFMFSGHGGIVSDRGNTITEFKNTEGKSRNGTILPIDWKTPDPTQVRDIMGKTLFLLSSQLKTDNLVMILDSCHSEGGLRGNSTVRSATNRGNGTVGDPSVFQPQLDLQATLQKRLNWTDAELQERRKKGVAKGVAMGAASFGNEADIFKPEALELTEKDVTAGAFTYLLTRYLWQASGNRSLDTDFTQLKLSSILNSKNPNQRPVYEVAPDSGNTTKPIFFATPSFPAAEGVIHEAPKGKEVRFWLGGASPDCLKAYETAVFNIIDQNGKILGELQQTHRSGLIGYGKMVPGSTLQPQMGMLLREQVRGITKNIPMNIGLDRSIGADLDAIKKGLLDIPNVKIVPIGQQKEIDYIIGRAKPTGPFHLFTPSLEILSDPIGGPNDTIETVMDKLGRQIKALQAKQLLKNIMGDASTMKISADLVPVEMIPKTLKVRSIGPAQSIMSQSAITAKPGTTASALEFPVNSLIQIRLQNQESETLYMAVMVITVSGNLSVIFPYGGGNITDEALVPQMSEKKLEIPFSSASSGVLELLIIASRRPLDQLLKTVERIAKANGAVSRGTPIAVKDDPIAFATDMLNDIDNISRAEAKASSGRKIVDMKQLTVVSAIVQVK
jgi:Caspase domain